MRRGIRTLARGNATIPLATADAWLRKQARMGRKNNPRCETYRLAHATLREIAHRDDLSDVSVEKLEQLIRACAERCGWAQPPLRECSQCQSLLPEDEFRRLATDAERRKYNWHSLSVRRYVTDTRCYACRRNADKREHYHRHKTIAATTSPLLTLERHLQTKIKNTAQALKRCRIVYGDDPANIYTHYNAQRLRCARIALALVQHRIDHTPEEEENPTKQNNIPEPRFWYDLLSDDDRRVLFDAHAALPRGKGRPVSV